MRIDESQDNIVTISSVALLAAIFANIGHHVLGHSLICLANGGRISVLTAFLFHCTVSTRVIDAGAGLMNFLLAALVWLALRSHKHHDPTLRLFLVLSFAFNLFWGSGQMIYSAALNQDDWAFALGGLIPDEIWRPVLVVLGGFLYVVAIKITQKELTSFSGNDADISEKRMRRIVFVSYSSAGLLTCAAASLYQPDLFGSIGQVALETFAINAGLLLTLRRKNFAIKNFALKKTILPSAQWIIVAVVAYITFAMTLGRGIY